MKYSVLLLSSLLCLAPMAPVLARATEVHVAYLGQGKYQYKKKAYVYQALVAAIQYDYSGERIDVVVVEMGSVASQIDKANVCQLRQSFMTLVRMELTVASGVQNMYCN